MAAEYGCYVFLPLYERAGEGEYYNSCALLAPDGSLIPGTLADGSSVAVARKVHVPLIDTPGAYSDERHWFRPGSGVVNFHTPLGVFGCLICYDRSFPEAWRTLVLRGAELVVVPVASYGFRKDLFLVELRTRAAENGVFAVAANRAGPEAVGVEVEMFGSSCIVGPLGEIISSANSNPPTEEILVAELELGAIHVARRMLPYLRDRRPETYILT